MQSLASTGHTTWILGAPSADDFTQDHKVHTVKDKGIQYYHFPNYVDGIDFVASDLMNYDKLIPLPDFPRRLHTWLADENELDEDFSRIAWFINDQIRRFKPTHLIFNESVTLKASAKYRDLIRVFICHACEHLPFGPYGAVPSFLSGISAIEVKRFNQLDAVFAVSKAVQKYIQDHGNFPAMHLPLPKGVYGSGPFNKLNNFDQKYVVAINPGIVKGFCLFKKIAMNLPEYTFVAVKSWSLCEHLQNELSTIPNVKIIPPFKDMEELLMVTRLLLVPSIWFEAFGIVVVEAMLRGIPVLTSNAGGLVESSLGVNGNIPVNMIQKKADKLNLVCCGLYEVPEQDPSQWVNSIRNILTDRDHYEKLSQRSYDVANQYVLDLDNSIYEQVLHQLQSKNMK